MDLQEKLNEIDTKIKQSTIDIEETKSILKLLKSMKKQCLKLIEKAKALEQK